MHSSVIKSSVFLPAEAWDRLGVISAERHTSRAQLVRTAVEYFLERDTAGRPNHKRVAELCEFNQLVLDLLVQRDFADRREEILDVLDQRIGQYHG